MSGTIQPEVRTGVSRRQNVKEGCGTRGRRNIRLTALHLLIVALGVAAAVWAYHAFQPVMFTHPDFDPAAVSGTPQVEEKYGYSTLTVDEEYAVRLCGAPANDGQTVDLFLTNPADNGVWFRAEVLDGDGEVLGVHRCAASGRVSALRHLQPAADGTGDPGDRSHRGL